MSYEERVSESDCRPQFFWPDFNLLSFVKVQNFFIYNLYGSDDEKVTGHRSRGSPTKKEAPFVGGRVSDISPAPGILIEKTSLFFSFSQGQCHTNMTTLKICFNLSYTKLYSLKQNMVQ